MQRIKQKMDFWAILSFAFIAMILLPNMVIGVNFFSKANENWYHIKEYLLFDIITNTVVMMSLTALITTIIGTSLAWIITVYRFPMRDFLKWGLILPLAIPPFIGAYTYHGMINYTGIIQSTLRNHFSLMVNQKYFSMMSMEGAVFVFTMFLFPYVYVITKSFFENQSSAIVDNARLLGANSLEIFLRVILPISRAAILGGVTIVMLEVINDYGVVKYFGIPTFTTAIFQTWFAMGDLDAAFKLAGSLMVVVIFILTFEKFARGRKQFSYANAKVSPIKPKQLKGKAAWTAFGFSFGVFSFSFLIPCLQLLYWVFMTYEKILTNDFFKLVKNSFMVSIISSVVIVSVALIIANYTRIHRGLLAKIISRITVLGYSIPGAVIAIGVITIFIGLDQQILSFLALFNRNPVIVFRTSLIMLIFAYIIRFLAVGYNSIEAGFEKTGNLFTEAARTLGSSTFHSFIAVDLPLVKGAILGGIILVFVDILKELPLTMLLQPFNFHTLATKAFVYANDEMINEAASASILIILISMICIYLFHKLLDKEGHF